MILNSVAIRVKLEISFNFVHVFLKTVIGWTLPYLLGHPSCTLVHPYTFLMHTLDTA